MFLLHASDHLPKILEQQSENGLVWAQVPTPSLRVVAKRGTERRERRANQMPRAALPTQPAPSRRPASSSVRMTRSTLFYPPNALLQLVSLMLAGWVNGQHRAVIEYLQEENRILLEQLGGKPRRFTDAQRMRLARKTKAIGRRRLKILTTAVTPDTLLRWFRNLIARKWTCARKTGPRRPPVEPEETDGRKSKLG
jgi:hypothetical protein